MRILYIAFILMAAAGGLMYMRINEAKTIAPKLSGNTPSQPIFTVPPTPRPLDAQILLSEINNWRVSVGKSKYLHNEKLCPGANERLRQIEFDWSHDNFVPVVKKYFKEGYDISENLARFQTSEIETLNHWLSSSVHKANLDKPYKFTCIEVNGGYAVQWFGNL